MDMYEKEFDIDETVTYVFDFIATIPEYWNRSNYNQKIKIQGLIFPEKPTYDYNRFQTPNISLVFAQKRELATAKSPIVRLQGLKWNTIEEIVLKWKHVFERFEIV